ncbi:MAG: hypothetical protein AAF547_08800 [Actinomycetota bacterium]
MGGLDRRRSGPVRDDGSVSVQAALIVVPALFFVLVLALQFTFAWMAAAAVQVAAENAADAASARDGTVADAQAAADRVLSESGYATVTSSNVAIGAETVRVEIRARAYQFLPVAWEVVGVAEAGIEDFRASTERR